MGDYCSMDATLTPTCMTWAIFNCFQEINRKSSAYWLATNSDAMFVHHVKHGSIEISIVYNF